MAEHNMPTSSLEGANTLISRTERESVKENPETPEKESSARIAPPKPKTWKDKLRESFVGNDVQSVGEYLIFSVLIPSVKSTLLSIINNGASMFLNGGPTQQSLYSNQRSNGSYVSYNYVTRNAGGYNSTSVSSNSPAASGLKNISWGSEMEANSVLSDMHDYIYSRNEVSVAKYYTLARVPGLRPNYQDDYWGWYNLDRACVVPSPVEPGRWIIDLPKPIYLR